jgi:hypothetical protein
MPQSLDGGRNQVRDNERKEDDEEDAGGGKLVEDHRHHHEDGECARDEDVDRGAPALLAACGLSRREVAQ